MPTSDGTSGWIRRFHDKPASRLRLVCLPHAGGSASSFFRFSAGAADPIEVLAVQYPGRQDRRAEAAVDDIAAMAAQTAEALRPWADRPLALFGHSMGALVAFETARALRERGIGEVVHLFVSGRCAPSRVREERPLDEWPEERVIAELQQLGGTDAALLSDPDVVRMMLPALRDDYRALRRYRAAAGDRVDCPVTAMVGDDDVTTTVAESKGWATHTAGPFRQHVFPGGHFYLVAAEMGVLRQVQRELSVAV
jgi:pyochelin biosynthetic protein PchC